MQLWGQGSFAVLLYCRWNVNMIQQGLQQALSRSSPSYHKDSRETCQSKTPKHPLKHKNQRASIEGVWVGIPLNETAPTSQERAAFWRRNFAPTLHPHGTAQPTTPNNCNSFSAPSGSSSESPQQNLSWSLLLVGAVLDDNLPSCPRSQNGAPPPCSHLAGRGTSTVWCLKRTILEISYNLEIHKFKSSPILLLPRILESALNIFLATWKAPFQHQPFDNLVLPKCCPNEDPRQTWVAKGIQLLHTHTQNIRKPNNKWHCHALSIAAPTSILQAQNNVMIWGGCVQGHRHTSPAANATDSPAQLWVSAQQAEDAVSQAMSPPLATAQGFGSQQTCQNLLAAGAWGRRSWKQMPAKICNQRSQDEIIGSLVR